MWYVLKFGLVCRDFLFRKCECTLHLAHGLMNESDTNNVTVNLSAYTADEITVLCAHFLKTGTSWV